MIPYASYALIIWVTACQVPSYAKSLERDLDRLTIESVSHGVTVRLTRSLSFCELLTEKGTGPYYLDLDMIEHRHPISDRILLLLTVQTLDAGPNKPGHLLTKACTGYYFCRASEVWSIDCLCFIISSA